MYVYPSTRVYVSLKLNVRYFDYFPLFRLLFVILVTVCCYLLVVDGDGAHGARRINDEGGTEGRRVVAHGRIVREDPVIR